MKFPLKQILGWGLFTIIFVFTPLASAAVFNPNTAAQLQVDLITAQNNGEDDTINLAANTTYNTADNGNVAFTYTASATENNTLTIVGADDGTTVLDGNSTNNILIITTTAPADDSSADLEIRRITIKSGVTPVQISTTMADVLLDSIETRLNQNLFFVQSSVGTTTINSSTFEDNIQFQLAVLSNTGTINFNNNIFRDNQISLFTLQSTLGNFIINANEIIDNSSPNTGVLVVQSLTGSVVLTNNIVAGNDLFGGFSATVYIMTTDSAVTLTNNTIFDNLTFDGIGGVGVMLALDTASANFFNNIIFSNLSLSGTPSVNDIGINDDGNGNNTGSPVLLANNDFSDFFSQCANTGGCTPDITQMANIDEDPLFVDPLAGDFNLGPGSPAIQAGDPNAAELPATDFADNPLNNPPDLGALATQFLLGINPADVDFGSVSTEVASPRTVTLTNQDGVGIEVTNISVEDTNNFSIGLGSCGSLPFTLPGGESCEIVVTFNPSSNGNFNATVTLTLNDPNNPTRTINLTGLGVNTGGGCAMGNHMPVSSTLILMMWVPLMLGLRRWLKIS